MNKKIKVGIDINEVFRYRYAQVEKYYIQEFGEEGLPKQSYVYDFFNEFTWKNQTEYIKELREPEETPENISPVEYQIDKKLGEAPADAFLFKKVEKKELTAKEVYNRFMYEDFVFEIHACAPMMYKNMDLHASQFYLKYRDYVDFTLFSVENYFSIPSTLFFLSKMTSRFKNIKFVETPTEMWNDCDVLITADPELLKIGKPWGKNLIKVKKPFNENIEVKDLTILDINDLNNNPIFEKIIKINNKKI